MNIVSCNKQRVVNLIAARLRNGKGRAVSEATGMCLYRTPDGNACAIGACMHDGEEPGALNMLGGVSKLFDQYPHLRAYWWARSESLLVQLQSVHDSLGNWDHTGRLNYCGEYALQSVCIEHALVYPQP